MLPIAPSAGPLDPFEPLPAIAGALSALAALLHVGCIVFGAPWYRFFGAGERMARAAVRGDLMPAVVTSFIVLVLTGWAAFAWSAAGLLPVLPQRAPVLVAITCVYLLRGLLPVPALAWRAGSTRRVAAFWWWSSATCLAIGLVHVAALWVTWGRL